MASLILHENGDDWPLVEFQHTDHEILVVMVNVADVMVQQNILDERERERGRRLRTAQLQHRYLAAHTALRHMLGWQLHADPAHLTFALDPYGKPSLRDHQQVFNLSHSGSFALVAMASDGALGVDLECGERLGEVDHLAKHVFAPAELQKFQALPPGARLQAFLIAWTRKESALKALGIGLPGGMENVLLTDESPHLRGDFLVLPQLKGLHVVDLPAISGYAAALCFGPQPRTVRCCRWPSTTTQTHNGELPTAGTT